MITLKLNHYSDSSKEVLLHALVIGHVDMLSDCSGSCETCQKKIPCEDMSRCVSYLRDIVHDNSTKR